jgi:hypothetical protein
LRPAVESTLPIVHFTYNTDTIFRFVIFISGRVQTLARFCFCFLIFWAFGYYLLQQHLHPPYPMLFVERIRQYSNTRQLTGHAVRETLQDFLLWTSWASDGQLCLDRSWVGCLVPRVTSRAVLCLPHSVTFECLAAYHISGEKEAHPYLGHQLNNHSVGLEMGSHLLYIYL